MDIFETTFRVKMTRPCNEITLLDMFYDGEDKETGYGQISIKPVSRVIKAKEHTLSGSYNMEQKESLEKNGLNADEVTKSALLGQMTNETEKELCDVYKELGKLNAVGLMTKWQKFLKKIFKNMEITSYGKLDMKIRLLANFVAVTSRRGSGDFAIVSPEMGAILSDSPDLVFTPVTTIHTTPIYHLGNLGKIAIFVNPWLPYKDATVIVGRMTSSSQPGVVFGELSEDFVNYISEATMSPTVKFVKRYVIEGIGQKPESNYVTARVIDGKKPLWKKMLGL